MPAQARYVELVVQAIVRLVDEHGSPNHFWPTDIGQKCPHLWVPSIGKILRDPRVNIGLESKRLLIEFRAGKTGFFVIDKEH
jgi:hypothetical protein